MKQFIPALFLVNLITFNLNIASNVQQPRSSNDWSSWVRCVTNNSSIVEFHHAPECQGVLNDTSQKPPQPQITTPTPFWRCFNAHVSGANRQQECHDLGQVMAKSTSEVLKSLENVANSLSPLSRE